jgi:HEPN domain-containing protein
LGRPCSPTKDRQGIMSEKTIQYWIDISEYDLQVAKSLLDKGHYLYVGFMCHQAVEKMLKALYVKQTSAVPPYIHKLDRLVDLVGLKAAMSKERNDFIDELTPLNIQARYPAYREAIYSLINKEKAAQIIEKTEELLQWLKAQIL